MKVAGTLKRQASLSVSESRKNQAARGMVYLLNGSIRISIPTGGVSAGGRASFTQVRGRS
jgi:hypothetical protein